MKSKLLIHFLIAISSILINTQLYSQTPTPTWSSLASGNSSTLVGAFFLNDSTGFVSGTNATILKTTDYGSTWDSLSIGVSTGVSDIYFLNKDTGFAVSGPSLLKTINGGISWSSITIGTSTTLTFIGQMNGSSLYITGYNGVILKSTDVGATWSILNSGTTYSLYGVYFTDSLTGYAVGNNGTIVKTINGGTSWTPLTTGTINQLLSVYFTDANTGYAVGGIGNMNTGIILKTSNAGNSWTSQSVTNAYMGSVKFVNATTGFAVGGDAVADTCKIFKTTDSGVTWTLQNIHSSRQYGSYFISENYGYTCGLNGTILKYSCTTCKKSNHCSITATITGNTYDLRIKTLPKVVFSGSGGKPPYTFSYTINGGSTQTISTITGDTVSINVPVANHATYTYKLIGVQDSTRCSQVQSDSVIFIINSILSINGANENSIAEIFPNPFNNQLNILVQASSAIKITDISGRELYNNKIETGTSVVETSNFTAGIYFFTLTNNRGTVTKKIIKN